MITAFALHYPVSIKKAVRHLPIRQRGSRSPYAQTGNAYRINGEAYSLFYVRIDNFSTFLRHKNQLNAFSLICKTIVVFTTAQI